MAIAPKLNEMLREELYKIATRPHPLWYDLDFKSTPLTRWQRLKYWWSARYPRIHFGPCDHSDCN